MSAIFPPELPCPRLAGTYQLPSSFVATDFEHSTRYRKRYTCDMVITMEFIFDEAETQHFMTWYKVNLDRGSLWFQADWNILGDTGIKEYHFDKAPEFEIVDQYYKLKADFVIKGLYNA